MKKYVAEFLGTLVLVLVSCGVAVITNANIVATSLAFGLSLLVMVYTIGPVSGCHINPAVSLSMFLTKKMSLKELIMYIIAQVLGALVGSLLLGIILGTNELLGANGFGGSLMADTAWIALLVEVILTFIFVLVILGVTNKKEYANISGVVIGLALSLVHLFGIPFTGTSVNPARSLAPALLQGGTALSQVWVFIVGPLLGALFASLIYNFVLKKN